MTDTAICIARELYETDPDNRVRQILIGGDIGYGQERENIKNLAVIFDKGYEALTEEEKGWLDPWDMEVVPLLLHCAADWDQLTSENVTHTLEDWISAEQEQRDRAKNEAKRMKR